eukprot:6858600-Karenia_brevis.AAC.1
MMIIIIILILIIVVIIVIKIIIAMLIMGSGIRHRALHVMARGTMREDIQSTQQLALGHRV